MLNFMDMLGNYDSRKVDRYEGGEGFFISTAYVCDSDKPYETAVAHPEYADGKIIIVECYDTKSEAQKGHDRWVKKMASEELPEELVDVSKSALTEFLRAIDPASLTFKRQVEDGWPEELD